MRVAVIPADTGQPVRIDEVDSVELDYLQKQCGGYVQLIGLGDSNMYLNEDGKMEGLPPNPRADALASEVLMFDDFVVGDVVVVGPVDDEGDDTGLTDEQIAKLTS